VVRLPGAVTALPPQSLDDRVRPAVGPIFLDGRKRALRGETVIRFTPLSGTAAVELQLDTIGAQRERSIELRYRLDGFDGDWIDPRRRRVARYPSLSPGRYRFRLQARDAGGEWSPHEATLDLVIEPRFYTAAAFQLGVGGGLAALIALALVLRVSRARAAARRLQRLVDERTRDLRAARDELQEANRTLERRVEEGIDALRGAERMAAYGRLVAGVAHEVRQPLFAVSTVSYVLADKLRGVADLAPQLALLDREVKRMSAMTDELLEFARPPRLLVAPTGIGELLDEAIETFRAEGEPGSIAIAAHAGAGLPNVTIDRGRMLQVLLNLMQNAKRHAAGVSRIELAAAAIAGDRVTITVENDGATIAAELLPGIFEPFVTGGRGTGLGLTIARHIVGSHGGTIDVTCDATTRFTITLPVAGPPPADPVTS
jgi:signal transduction histidine kinase